MIQTLLSRLPSEIPTASVSQLSPSRTAQRFTPVFGSVTFFWSTAAADAGRFFTLLG
jgi:hypothetical protein